MMFFGMLSRLFALLAIVCVLGYVATRVVPEIRRDDFSGIIMISIYGGLSLLCFLAGRGGK